MSQATPPTVFVVDDDAAVRDSIAELVESVGLRCETHASAPAFLQAFDPERPGCLVLDVRMAEMSGLALQERLNTLRARIPVIMLTGHGDVPMAVTALKAGAHDFIEKPFKEQALLDLVDGAVRASRERMAAAAAQRGIEARFARLNKREREVMERVIAGLANKVIADELDISVRTVEVHRARMFEKMNVRSAVELANLLREQGP